MNKESEEQSSSSSVDEDIGFEGNNHIVKEKENNK